MALERYHPIWEYARKIKDPALGMLVTKIIYDYADKFYTVPIPGLSTVSAGKSGWSIVSKMCVAVDNVKASLGNPALNYDKLYAMALISLCGVGDYVSMTEDDDTTYLSSSRVYRYNDWKEWNISWSNKVFEMGKEIGVDANTNREMFQLISDIGDKLEKYEIYNLSEEAVSMLIIYSLTVKF